jgi:SAM-dependent methyltransferase
MARIETIREYWNTYVNDIEVCQNSPGTPEFFDELEAYRYDKIDYLHDYVRFDRYRSLRVLEVGCGPGVDLVQFARAGADAWAIDLTENAVRLSRQHLATRGYPRLAAQVQQASAEELPFPDASFDVVYSHGVLHHTPDTEKAIGEVHRVLRPRGEAVIMLYNRHSWFYALHRVSKTNVEHRDGDPPIIRCYTTAECRRLFERFSGPIEIHVDRLPKVTRKFTGAAARLFNHLLVPMYRLIPRRVSRRFGWHIMIRAFKVLALKVSAVGSLDLVPGLLIA